MAKPRLDKPRGVLGASTTAPSTHRRFLPSAPLAPFIEHYWYVRWDVAERQVAEVLAHPSIHVVFERGRSSVAGPARGRFIRVLEGKGVVLGTKFHPGCFRPFVDFPVSRLVDGAASVESIFGDRAKALEREVLRLLDEEAVDAAIAEIESFLIELRPPRDYAADLARRIASRIATDRSIVKVEHITEAFDLGTRQLQRLFREYIGPTPKWVIQRYRLQEASERIRSGDVESWAGLAVDLGYADQAHFIRDFKKVVGVAPTAYAKRLSR